MLILDLCDELATAEDVGSRLTDHRWSLASIEVANFRGARRKSVLRLDPLHGLTVLHGQNGSGKTTMIEAMRVAIHGTLDPSHIGQSTSSSRTRGKLWSAAEQRPDPSSPCRILVVLESVDVRGAVLEIKAEFNDDHRVRRTATLTHAGGGTTKISDDSAEWKLWDIAARAFPPSYSYAALNEEIRNPEDIHGWLYSSLGLGLAPAAFQDALVGRLNGAYECSRTVESLLEKAKEAVGEIDDAARSNGIVVDEIEWENVDSQTDIEEWCARSSVGTGDGVRATMPDESVRLVDESARVLKQAFDAWRRAAIAGLDDQCLDALLRFHDALTSPHSHIKNDACPVCGSENQDWSRAFRDRVTGWKVSDEARLKRDQAVDQQGPRLVSLIEATLDNLPEEHLAMDRVQSLQEDLPSQEQMKSAAYLRGPEFRKVLECLVRLVEEEETLALVDVAVRNAGRRAGWMNERRRAMAEFLEIDRDTRRSAEELPILTSARAIWNPVLRQLREERKSVLEGRIGGVVGDLFAEQKIQLDGVALPKSEKGFEMHLSQMACEARSDGGAMAKPAKIAKLELAHLSAGQRNLLLLSPMIAAPLEGLFAFRIFDDPVHALDEVRVDRLSQELATRMPSVQVVIATHDARLAEHLTIPAKGAVSYYDISLVDGRVEVESVGKPWEQLLLMASETRGELGAAQKGGIEDPQHNVADLPSCAVEVRTLLRMALDACLEYVLRRRAWLVQESTRSGAELASSVSLEKFIDRIYEAKTLRHRIALLLSTDLPDGVRQGVDLSREVLQGVDGCVAMWNGASHAALNDSADGAQQVDMGVLRSEIRSCRHACRSLVEIWE